jgi:putative NADH-flavin reductase
MPCRRELLIKRWSSDERTMCVFVAGASGAIGEPLIPQSLERGRSVVGMTTSEAQAKNLESQGAEAVILDVFDTPAVEAALRRSKAEVVIDELTPLLKAQSDMPKCAAGADACGVGRRGPDTWHRTIGGR